MDLLKKIWPMSFKNNDSVQNLVIGVVIYAVAAIIAGLILGVSGLVAGLMPEMLGKLIGLVLGAIGSLIDLYCVGGIVFKFLAYFKVIGE